MIKNQTYCAYLLKYYKKIRQSKKSNVLEYDIDTDDSAISSFDLWMNFDHLLVIPVQRFEDFQFKSLDIDNPRTMDVFFERQKQYLIGVKNEKTENIFKSNAYYPLLAITTIECDLEFDKLIELINEKKEKQKQIEFVVFYTLAFNSYIVVFRATKYLDIYNLLFDLKLDAQRIYTISGIDKNTIELWDDINLNVSIRISTVGAFSTQELINKINLNILPVDETSSRINLIDILDTIEIQRVFGKYDYEICGKIKDLKLFYHLYTKGNVFYSLTNNGFITSVNTRFVDRITDTLSLEQPGIEESKSEDDFSIEKDDDLLKIPQNIPHTIRTSLNRLSIRLKQVDITIQGSNHGDHYINLTNLTNTFLQLCEKYPEDTKSTVCGMNSIAVLMDNRISVNNRDFETPKSSVRFVGASFKLVEMYTVFAQSLVRAYAQDNMFYHVFVTAESYEGVRAIDIFPRDKTVKFIDFQIPVEMLFDIKTVISWIAHELGHFIVKPDCELYFLSFYDAFLVTYLDSLNNLMQGHTLAAEDYYGLCVQMFLDMNNNTQCSEINCSDYQDSCVLGIKCDNFGLDRFINIINSGLRSLLFSSNNFTARETLLLIENSEEILTTIKDIYEETISDMFMVNVCGIDHVSDYLKIVKAMLYSSNMNNLTDNITVRISTIVLYITQKNSREIKSNSELEKDFKNALNENTIFLADELNKLKNWKLKRSNFIIYKFLKQCTVKEEFEKNENEIATKLKQINEYLYNENETEDITKYWNYISEILAIH